MIYFLTYLISYFIITYIFVRYNENSETKLTFKKSWIFQEVKIKSNLFDDSWIKTRQVEKQMIKFVEDTSLFDQAFKRLQKKWLKSKN